MVTDLKITDAQLQNAGVKSLADKVTGQAATVKGKIDGTGTLVAGQFNSLVDALVASGNGVNADKLGGEAKAYYATAAAVQAAQSAAGAAQSTANAAQSTANAAQSKANGALQKSGGSLSGDLETWNVIPSANNTYTLGNDGRRMKHIYGFQFHAGSLITLDDASTEWKNIQAFTTIAFRKRDAAGTKINIDAANAQAPSSIRYKENIQDVTEEDALQILKLRPVSYDYKPDGGYEGKSKAFIAEEAAEVDERYAYQVAHTIKPEVSHVDEETGERIVDEPAEYEMRIEGLNQNPIICDLVALCQRQQKQIDHMGEKAAKYDAMLALLAAKGVFTQEEWKSYKEERK